MSHEWASHRACGLFGARCAFSVSARIARSGGSHAVPGHDLNVKLLATFPGQRVNQTHERGEMNPRGRGFTGAKSAIEVPVVNACGQRTAAFPFDVFADIVLARFQQAVATLAFKGQDIGLSPVASLFSSASSSALQEGEHTAWDLPSTLRVPIIERARCLPHMKHDMVAAPKDVVAANGEPDTLDL